MFVSWTLICEAYCCPPSLAEDAVYFSLLLKLLKLDLRVAHNLCGDLWRC